MIVKVMRRRGSQTLELLSYLYGPGSHHEHTDPHLVASWDGLVTDPGHARPHEFTGRLGWLSEELDRLVLIHAGPGRHVWHCAARTAPADRRLTDAEWRHAAHALIDAAGIASRQDPAGCRWIAVRHADDHIHLVATLRRMDGKTPRLGNDFLRLRRACQQLEQRYGLRPTPPVEWTAARRPTRAEYGKAQRLAYHLAQPPARRRGGARAHPAGHQPVAAALQTGPYLHRLTESAPHDQPDPPTAHSRPATRSRPGAMAEITAQWALQSKPPGISDDYSILYSSDLRLPYRAILRRYQTGIAPGPAARRAERYPRITIGPHRFAGQDYLGIAVERWSEQRDGAGRDIAATSYFALPHDPATPAISFLDLHQAIKGISLSQRAGQAAPPGSGIVLNLPGYDPQRLAELVARHGIQRCASAAASLLAGNVDVIDARARTGYQARLEIIDAVAALLPYQLRLNLAACTWASTSDHQMRLAFSGRARPGAHPLDPAAPRAAPDDRQARDYHRLLTSVTDDPGRLAAVIGALAEDRSPQQFTQPHRALASLRTAVAAAHRTHPRTGPASPPQAAQHTAATGNSPAADTSIATPRETLADLASRAAAAASDDASFLLGLHTAGLHVRLHQLARPDGPAAITGYEVSLPGDTDRAGDPIWYAGSTLAPDLSLPRVRERWEGVFRPPDPVGPPAARATGDPAHARAQAWEEAVGPLGQAAHAFGHDDSHATEAERAATAQAVGDFLTVAADQAPDHIRQQILAAAHAFERGSRVPLERAHGDASSGLRLATQGMNAAGQAMASGREAAAMAAVVVASAGALQAAIGWYHARKFTAQAASAQRALTHLQLAAWQLDPARHSPDPRAAHRPDLQQTVRAVLGGAIDTRWVLADPAYPVLATVLARAGHAGADPAQMLHSAVLDANVRRGTPPGPPLTDALAFHIQRRLHAQAPGHGQPPPQQQQPTIASPDAAPSREQHYRDILQHALAAAPGAVTAEQVMADPAWRTVDARLRRAAAAGHRPDAVLAAVAAQPRGFTDAHSTAKVLVWRIDQWMKQPSQPSGSGPTHQARRRPHRDGPDEPHHRHRPR
ncbi:hypothetical protein AGRA3207_007480 [Actinomadura graeca]|uniref:MobA/VirD2-like nuclease domain-containing protein n=1 Tax=Actinomadura graeca TaxID=2750812 RepID=A0ABX8R4A8_9ACTN|nr:relaxase/mobilization nuclease domain-containing protein [Actinomadura graeca]QXJ25911.1 hypothetical protein AGRA3207_007480 [Actinomadura graeca]